MYSHIPTRRPPGLLERNSLMGLGDPITMAMSFNPVTAGISAGVGLATVALGSWLSDKRQTGQQKIASTSVVNDLEPLLRANADAFRNGPGTCQDQAAALAAFDSAMQWLQSPQGCGNMQLGAPGQACINDRLQGGKWDWYAMYRNPIANDPRPQCQATPDSAAQSAIANIINHISGSDVVTSPQSYSTAPPAQQQVVTSSGVVAGVDTSSLLLIGGIGVMLLLVVVAVK